MGRTTAGLRAPLGSNGYSTISAYNTFAAEAPRRNGGQQTNCRVNILANASLATGHTLAIWYRETTAADAPVQERRWMSTFGKPDWNRRIEREGR